MKAAARSEFLGQAVGLLGEGAVKTAPSDLEPYCTDWRKRFFGKAAAILFPSEPESLAKIVRLANQYQIALVPQGGNTAYRAGRPQTPQASKLLCRY